MNRSLRDRAVDKAPELLLAAGALISVVVLLVLVRHLSYFGDSWEFLMNRRHLTADAVFEPHAEHIVPLQVLVTQLLLHVFGMTSPMPEYVLLALGVAATAVLLYIYVARRIGRWPALFAALLLLFLGPAYEVLLWSFEIEYVGSMLFGLAMLLALERRDRRGDVIACLALICCFGFSSLGIAFTIAGIVAILLGPRSSWRERAFVVVIPIVLYALWWIGWGHNAESHFSIHNLLASPRFVAEVAAVGVGSLSGLGTDPTTLSAEPIWGRTLLVALLVAFGVLIHRRKRVDPIVWPVVAAAVANWFLTAFNEIPGREPTASRYMYVSAIFIMMIVAGLLRGTRIGKRALIVAAIVVALVIAPNLVVLHKGREFFAESTIYTRSDTAALEIARPTVRPGFNLSNEVAGIPTLVNINAKQYFEAVDEFGSPAYSEAELAAAGEQGRRQADIVLSKALPISTVTHEGGYDASLGGCVQAGGGQQVEAQLTAGRWRIEVPPGTEGTPSLRRFAEGEHPVVLPAVPGGSEQVVTIPADESSRPWYLYVESTEPVSVCGG
jgi:hypothetical protein